MSRKYSSSTHLAGPMLLIILHTNSELGKRQFQIKELSISTLIINLKQCQVAKKFLLIHLADPQSRGHCFRTCPFRPHFQNLAKQNKYQAKTMFTTGENVGLTERIIDDTCLVTYLLFVMYLCFADDIHPLCTLRRPENNFSLESR